MEKIKNFVKAFSLIELMITIITISAITAAFTPVLSKKIQSSINSSSKGNRLSIVECKTKFNEDCKFCTNDACLICIKDCDKGQKLDKSSCKCVSCKELTGTDNCDECSSNTCNKCSQGYYLDNGVCVGCPAGYKCPNGVIKEECNPELRQYQDEPLQTECKTCEGCYSCVSPESGNCASCSKGKKKTGNSCGLCEAGTYQENDGYTGSSCTACPPGKYNTGTGNSGCMNCNVANCKTYSSGCDCSSCESGYYIKNKKCEPCPAGYTCNGVDACNVANCATYSSGCSCSTCAAGYKLSGGSCVSCGVANCNAYSSGCTCSACAARYYINGSTCTSCSVFGTQCSVCTSSGCTNCGSDATPNSQGVCEANCSVEHCETCVSGNPNACETCETGYYAKSNVCESCGTSGYYYVSKSQQSCPNTVCSISSLKSTAPGCITCASYQCLSCCVGYDLVKGNIPGISSRGYYCLSNGEDGACVTCGSGYYRKDGSCQTCGGGNYWNGTACGCKSGYYANSSGDCYSCISAFGSSCATCTQSGCTQSCSGGVCYAWNGKCYQCGSWPTTSCSRFGGYNWDKVSPTTCPGPGSASGTCSKSGSSDYCNSLNCGDCAKCYVTGSGSEAECRCAYSCN